MKKCSPTAAIPTHGQMLTVYSLGHCLVDLISALIVVSLTASAPDARPAILLCYNFCAFALQMPAGILADRFGRYARLAAVGLLLTLFSATFFAFPVLCALLAGVGNCLYHIGGGTHILQYSDKKQWMLGVFVSPGALGLFVGSFLAAQGALFDLPTLSILILAVLILAFLLLRLSACTENARDAMTPPDRAAHPIPAGGLLFLVVVLRSYIGMTVSFPWKTGYWALLFVLGVVLGKTAGGFLADRIGTLSAATLSLVPCALLLLFPASPVCGTLAMFLFNMTMPMTLWAMARLFPGARGFSFGALTFALFLGFLPKMFPIVPSFAGTGAWYAAGALVSLLLLAAGLFFCRPKAKSSAGKAGMTP